MWELKERVSIQLGPRAPSHCWSLTLLWSCQGGSITSKGLPSVIVIVAATRQTTHASVYLGASNVFACQWSIPHTQEYLPNCSLGSISRSLALRWLTSSLPAFHDTFCLHTFHPLITRQWRRFLALLPIGCQRSIHGSPPRQAALHPCLQACDCDGSNYISQIDSVVGYSILSLN